MKLAIVGSRNFNDYERLEKEISETFNIDDINIIVSGGAKGADSLGMRFAKNHKIPYQEILPDWDKHGKRAGFIRNHDIVKNTDKLIAFWDGESEGTKHTIGIAKKALRIRNVKVVNLKKDKEIF